MKKFFKALALVLALTLVLGTVPASAADSYSVKKAKKTLYVALNADADKNAVTAMGSNAAAGTTSQLKARVTYASILGISKKEAKKLDITTVVKSSVEGAVVANDNTRAIRVYGIGEATVAFKVNGKDAGTTTIIAKKSATDATVIFGRDLKETSEFAASTDVAFEVSLPRNTKDEDGNKVSLDTDERRLVIKDADENVIYNVSKSIAEADQVNKTDIVVVAEDATSPRLWSVKFLKTGTYTIYGEAYQSNKKYPDATGKNFVTVKVSAGKLEEIRQTTYNTFELDFSTPTIAKAAVDETYKYFSIGSANVTEAKDVIKVFEVGEHGEEIAMFIGSGLKVKEDGSKVAVVPMQKNLVPGTTYIVRYGADENYVEKYFVASDWIPNDFKVGYSYTANASGVGGEAVFTLHDSRILNTQPTVRVYSATEVDITDVVAQYSTVIYEDTINDYSKYSLGGDRVYFYVNGVVAKINATYNYNGPSGYSEEEKYKFTNIKLEQKDILVSAQDDAKYYVKAWDISTTAGAPATSNPVQVICYEDGLRNLRVTVGATTYDLSVSTNDADITFKTTNADKLAINESTGEIYAPKAADGTIGVYVYYRNKPVDYDKTTDVIDPIPVKIVAKRVLATFEVKAAGNTKYSYNSNTTLGKYQYSLNGLGNKIGFVFDIKDSTGAFYNDVDIFIQKMNNTLDGKVWFNPTAIAEADGAVTGNLVDISTTPESALTWLTTGILDADKKLYFAATTDKTGVQTIAMKVTVKDRNSNAVRSAVISFTVKDTKNSTIISKALENITGTKYRVVAKDNEGYNVCGYLVDNSVSTAAFQAQFTGKNELDGSMPAYVEYVSTKDGSVVKSAVSADKKTVVLKEVIENVLGGGLTKINSSSSVAATGDAIAVSPTAIKVMKHEATANRFADTTNYLVRLYSIKNNSAYIVNAANCSYAPSVPTIKFFVNTLYSSYTDVVEVLDEAFKFDTWAIGADATNNDKRTDKGAKFSSLALPGGVLVSYVQDKDAITFLYVYYYDAVKDIYSETLINRTVYTGVVK